jgi:3-hydroxybutyryl-CoA dehydrogenase
MEIRRVCVVGAGTMGAEIAKWAVQGGYEVAIQDVSETIVRKVVDRIHETLLRGVPEQDTWHLMVEALKLEHPEFFEGLSVPDISPEQLEYLVHAMKGTTNLDDACRDADIVIEAVFEDISLKQGIFRKLDAMCPSHTILASNSSTIMISRLAVQTGRPDRCIGMHFMGPMPLVEVIRGTATSDSTVRNIVKLARDMGKKPIVLNKEWPGFVANSVSGGGGREAHWLLEKKIATVEQIDDIAITGLGYIRGPFMVEDFVGLDVIHDAQVSIFEQTGDPMDKPSPLLEEKLNRGELGMKTGKGFYNWS